MDLPLYFSQYFHIAPGTLEEYGAFDISIVSDLPLFIDPFLLFNSDNPRYQELHEEILRYLRFLRDQAASLDLNDGLIDSWYRFKEVKQNWLGFTVLGNGGAGLGEKFARSLHGSLGGIFHNFGEETVTSGSHLEKLCLMQDGVGRDNISDFTTNLIKSFLCEYTESFALEHMLESECSVFPVSRAYFNYQTQTWATKRYYLPRLRNDFVLLTPVDILTRDETWINERDMISRFEQIPLAVSDAQQRANINRYFARRLGENPKPKQRREAVRQTIEKFPELIDLYIKLQEEGGDRATSTSSRKVRETYQSLVLYVQNALSKLTSETNFYDIPWMCYHECLDRVRFFKAYIEDNDGYLLFNREGEAFSNEKDLQLAFGLVWCGSEFDINREVNNGRGPVDFKASYGAGDSSLIEFKLASNRSLKRNLENQVKVYEAANRTWKSIKVIVIYTAAQERKVNEILRELRLVGAESIILIDARSDNKPSASRA